MLSFRMNGYCQNYVLLDRGRPNPKDRQESMLTDTLPRSDGRNLENKRLLSTRSSCFI